MKLGFAQAKPPEHSEYPKTLCHPDYAPARMISPDSHGSPVSADNPMAATARLFSYKPEVWEPERNPPVIAHNTAEEARYAALGYFCPGKSDPAAFAAATSPAMAPSSAGREFQEFPKYVTSPTGAQTLVRSTTEHATLLAQWREDAQKGNALEERRS